MHFRAEQTDARGTTLALAHGIDTYRRDRRIQFNGAAHGGRSMFQFQKYSRLIPVALASVLAAGCSQLPTQPIVDSASPGMEAMRAQADPTRLVPPPPTDQPLSSQSQARIQGNRGGKISTGIFTAIIPAGAYSGFATVSITQPDITQPVAVLEIYPASKNGFHKPVLLIAQLPNVDPTLLMQTGMAELDPATGEWMSMNGETQNPQFMTVTTPLMHFSTYRVEFPVPGELTGGGGTSTGGSNTGGGKSTIQD